MINIICIILLIAGFALIAYGIHVGTKAQMDDWGFATWVIFGLLSILTSAIIKLGEWLWSLF